MSDQTPSQDQTVAQTVAQPVETVTLTIDGREVTVPKGTNVLEAAKTLGIDISAFCYHPGLSIAACCRQCLVSVEKMPKLAPSCQTIAGDGMVVHTEDAVSKQARKMLLEFTLLNHPVGCPICDKAGECTLQKLYFDHDNEFSRRDVPKVHKPKAVDLGPHIVLDAERCILCTRCIRVCDEVAGVHQLEMNQRGNHETLGTAPGARLDNPYSLNTVDVCPVGALTAKDFRFTMRAWELDMTPSVCTGCATGCNIEIHHNSGRVWRLVPRHKPGVNDYWMCDEGRFTYHELREDRLAGPVVDGLPASWERALGQAAEKLGANLAADKSRVGVVLSAAAGNEDNFALAKLASEIWELEHIYIGGRKSAPERADDILRDADVNGNGAGVEAIAAALSPNGGKPGDAAALESDLVDGKLAALVVLGHELELSDEARVAAGKLDALVVIAAREVGLATAASVALPASMWAEADGTITNRQGMVQRLQAAISPPGQAAPAWRSVVRLARACDVAMNYESAKAVFTEMVAQVSAFKDARWGRAARPVKLRFAGSRG